jgi:prepilin signal peptidase PulO-like enzyme (type II secretory pathway)
VVAIHFLLFSSIISVLDIRHHRIRKWHVYLGLLTLAPLCELKVFITIAINFCLYAVIFIISRKSLGFGDVRLSLLVGAYIGLWSIAPVSILLSNAYAWSTAMILVVGRWLIDRKSINTRVAFAPHMFFGAALAALWH